LASSCSGRQLRGCQIRPVITVGAEAMDKIFASEQ
jgi:hypothetical protein